MVMLRFAPVALDSRLARNQSIQRKSTTLNKLADKLPITGIADLPMSPSSSTLCPKCEEVLCITTQKKGKCLSFMESLQRELRWWAPGSVTSVDVLRAHKVHSKCFSVFWNGVNRIKLYFHHIDDHKDGPPRKVQNLVLADLLRELLGKARLAAFEFAICPMDRAPGPVTFPFFALAKNDGQKAVYFPNMMRPPKLRVKLNSQSQETYAWGYDLLNYSLPWKVKKETLFYRGSCVGLRPWGNKAKDVCLGHKKKEKLPFHTDMGLVGNPKLWSGKCRSLVENCHGRFVSWQKTAENKYLDILQGNGYTGRYKEFLAFNSLNFKRYDFNIYELFEIGMLSGRGGHIIDGTTMSQQEFHGAVAWAQAHDGVAEIMARNAERHVRWAMADSTILCVVWQLLANYTKLLGYNPAETPAISEFRSKRIGRDAIKSLVVAESRKLYNDEENLYTAIVEKLATDEDHTNFIKTCEPILVYPELL